MEALRLAEKMEVLACRGSLCIRLTGVNGDLSDRQHLRVVSLLIRKPGAIRGVTRLAGVDITGASQRLRILHDKGLIRHGHSKGRVCCKLTSSEIISLFCLLHSIKRSRLREVDRVGRSFRGGSICTVSLSTTCGGTGDNRVRLVSIHPTSRCTATRVTRTGGVPLPRLGRGLSALPTSGSIIICYHNGLYACTAQTTEVLDRSNCGIRDLGRDACS